MKKALLISSIIALALAACSPASEQDISEAKAKIAPLAEAKADQQAVFKEVAKYGPNCKIGTMHWIRNSDAREQYMNAVICDDAATASLQYQVGKLSETVIHIGYKVDPEKAAKGWESLRGDQVEQVIGLTEERKRLENEAKLKEEQRQEVLNKLTKAEREILGL